MAETEGPGPERQLNRMSSALIKSIRWRRWQTALRFPPAGVPGWTPEKLLPWPEVSTGSAVVPGMPTGMSFYHAAMEHRMASGDVSMPGAAAASAGFCRPASSFFPNADLSLLVHCPPEGEWIGMASETKAGADGAGTTLSRRYDVHGPVGVAGQTLAVRNRRG